MKIPSRSSTAATAAGTRLLSALHCVSGGRFTAFRGLRNCLSRPPIAWSRYRATGRGSGACASTIDGESALSGGMGMPMRSRLSTITEPALDGAELDEGARMAPLQPGEMLREEFMKPLGLSSNALAMELRVPVTRISEIVRERRGITADTALRLARYFSMSAEFWMRLQMDFDLESAADAEESAIHQEIRPPATRPLPAARGAGG